MSKPYESTGKSGKSACAKRETGRKPYVKPSLERLGGLREITLGGSLGVGESGGRKIKIGRG